MVVKILICLVLGYLFGCFSTGYFIGKLHHIDIRKYGSGNLGATNVLRTLGKKEALITLTGDMLKCVVPVFLVKFLIFQGLPETRLLGLYVAFGTVLGHNFPFYLNFKGGKGIAAMSMGILTFFDWGLVALCFVTFFSIVLITRYVSLGSILIALEFPIWIAVFYRGDWHLFILSALFAALAVFAHRANIVRLLHGNENKIGEKKKEEKKKEDAELSAQER